MVCVPLDPDQAEWLHTQGKDISATLRRLVDAAIRQQTLRHALAEERHIELVIRRHADKLAARLLPELRLDRHDETYNARASQIEAQAHRELLPAFERSEDPCMRHAARRFRFRFGVQADGTIRNFGASRRLQALRERRPGGWRRWPRALAEAGAARSDCAGQRGHTGHKQPR